MAQAPSGAAVLATIFVLIVVAAVVIAARIYLRLRIQKRRLLSSDLLMIAAWCSALTSASFDIVFMKNGVLDPHYNYTLANFDGDPETLQYILKVMWASVIPFFTTFYLCKASLLSVYLQLFPPSMRKRRITLWVVLVYCALAYIVSILLQLFLCFPIDRNWSITQPAKLCGENITATIFQVAWSLHFFGSLTLFILPFLILYNLNMRLKTKLGVYCVFLLGLIDIAFSLTRFLTIQLTEEGSFHSITTIELWSALDAYIGLIIACLPSLRPYLRRNLGSSSQYNYNESGRQAKSVPTRRPVQSGFEEIDECCPEDIEGAIHMPGVERATESLEFGPDDDRKSNSSDIELVHISIGKHGK